MLGKYYKFFNKKKIYELQKKPQVNGASQALKLVISPTNVTVQAFQELKINNLILYESVSWEQRFASPPDCQLLKNGGEKTWPTILGVNEHATSDCTRLNSIFWSIC
jgi:hypothetical protein